MLADELSSRIAAPTNSGSCWVSVASAFGIAPDGCHGFEGLYYGGGRQERRDLDGERL
jgi:hypothetical protein